MKHRFWDAMVLTMALGFFAIFLAVHASIAGDGISAAIMWLLGIGAVVAGTALNAHGRYIESCHRIQANTGEIRGSYERLNDGHSGADVTIDPATIYPLWQKCNRCGVYLCHHGTEDHPWVELDMEAEQRRDGHHVKGLNWDLGPGYIVEHDEPDDDVEVFAWGQVEPIAKKEHGDNPHISIVLGCWCPACTRRRNSS